MATYKNTVGGVNPEKRPKPRLNVVRGYPGNETTALSRSLPIGSGVTIKSGQAISDVGGSWALADNTSGKGTVFIAYHDGSDPDVKSCGKLLGFSVLGSFELETGYAKLTDVFAAGDPVYVDTTAGTLTRTSNAGAPAIGYASAALIDWSTPAYGTGVTPYAKDNLAQNTEASAANSKVLRFSTGN